MLCYYYTAFFRGKKKRDFIRHLKIHSGERPYAFEYFEETFSKESSINILLYVHIDGKTLHLSVLPKAFSNVNNLEKPLVKSHCRKSFSFWAIPDNVFWKRWIGKSPSNSHCWKLYARNIVTKKHFFWLFVILKEHINVI